METIKLDLIPGKKMPSLHASQYDDGRDYHIDLTENRLPYTLDGTETISLTVRKCDNTLVTMDIANTFADKSYIEFRTTEQMNACAGFNYGEIVLEDNGTRIGSLNFYLQVEGAPDEGGITSQSEINNLARQVHDIVVEELEDNGASDTGYDNTESGLEATNVQDAIDELASATPEDVYTKEESDQKFATISSIPTKTSQLQNDSDFTTMQAVEQALPALAEPVVEALVPTVIGNNYYNKTQTDEKIANLIDDEHTATNKTWSGQKINNAIIDVMPTAKANGSPATFDTSITAPLIHIKADMPGTETGTGARSPSNPYTLSVFNAVELKHYVDDVADADVLSFVLGGDYYVGELNIVDKGNGYASVKFIGKYKKIVIDSSKLSSTSWYASYQQLGINSVLTDAFYASDKITYNCDKLKPIRNNARGSDVGNYITLIGNGSGIAVSIPNCDTEAKAKAFFNNDSLVFCYELATYVEVDLPDISSIVAFSGLNNLLANCGDVEVEYKRAIEDVETELDNGLDETNALVNQKTKCRLEIKTIKLASAQSPSASTKNLCFVCGKWINKQGNIPDYVGYLFLDEATEKFYYTSDLETEPQFLFDWNTTVSGGNSCKYYSPTITADGDVIFLKDHARANPIVYPHEDYANPYAVNFGADRKPFGWLMSSSVVQFDDGSFVWGDYASHSLEDEQNDVRRDIWRVTKPYNDVSSWQIVHSFKHVYFESPQSDEPDNEIGHIHAIMYDFYADDLYCTTGDIDRHCRMWISTDHGETWAAVPGAVGTTEDTTVSGEGQKWRMTNGIFTADAMWWATDARKPYHKMWKCTRDNNGHVDFDTLTEVVDLETPALPNNYSQRTYIIALVRDPDGLLILDRGEPRPDKLDIKFYDFATDEIEIVRTFERATTDASELEQENRIGLPQQCSTIYQPQTLLGIITGGGTYVRPNNTSEFNNSKSNYVGALIMRLK